MKALLLAAGFGTRLMPITKTTPKCLMIFNERPLLDYWICHLVEDIQCEKIFINTHHLASKVNAFVRSHKYKNKIQTIHEQTLLDTAGTVAKVISDLSENFLIIHADNIITHSIEDFVFSNWKSPKSFLKALCVLKNDVENFGIFSVNKDLTVNGFKEKPKFSKSKIANGAIYLANKNFVEYIKQYKIEGNFSHNVINKIFLNIEVYLYKGDFFDIGTPKDLQDIRNRLKNGEIKLWEKK